MRGTAFNFFMVATLCVTIGMGLGLKMAIGGNHNIIGAHAHLNLVGWATMALFGIYYHLTPQAGGTGLAKAHFYIATLGVILFIPGIALAENGGTPIYAIVGSLLTALSMLIFVVTVARNGLGKA